MPPLPGATLHTVRSFQEEARTNCSVDRPISGQEMEETVDLTYLRPPPASSHRPDDDDDPVVRRTATALAALTVSTCENPTRRLGAERLLSRYRQFLR
jgi:hypothetical protein